MGRIRAFLTPAKRKATYATLAAVGLLVQMLGWADAVTVAHWLDVASQVLAIGGLVMATLNTDTSTGSGMPKEEASQQVEIDAPGGATIPADGRPYDVTVNYEGKHEGGEL